MTLRVLRALLCAKVNGGLDSRLRGNDGVATKERPSCRKDKATGVWIPACAGMTEWRGNDGRARE